MMKSKKQPRYEGILQQTFAPDRACLRLASPWLCLLAILMAAVTLTARRQATSPMTAFTGRLTLSYVHAIAGNDAALKSILLETFESDWSKAKECLLFDWWPGNTTKPRDHAAGLALMDELVKLRTKVCNAVVVDTQARIVDALRKNVDKNLEVLQTNDTRFSPSPWNESELRAAFSQELDSTDTEHFVLLAPTGAEKRTSDIDVASWGNNTELGVGLFNQNFRSELRVQWDPATVFDFNVYAADWIFPTQFIEEFNNGVTTITPQPEHVLARDGGGTQGDDIRLQTDRARIFEKASLLHLRRNCDPKEWNAYIARRAYEGPMVVNTFQQVNEQFAAFNQEIELQRLEIEKTIGRRASVWGDRNRRFYQEAIETRARNQIYQDRLLRVKILRLHYQVLKHKSDRTNADRELMFTLAKQITSELTEADFFANEAYATEGATLHATQAIQRVARAKKAGKALQVILTRDQYMQSFHENVADSLHSVNHYKDLDESYAAYRAGKYIERMLLAGQALGLATVLAEHHMHAELKGLSDEAARVKNSADSDDPAKIRQNAKFKRTDLMRLRDAILSIGSDIPGKAVF